MTTLSDLLATLSTSECVTFFSSCLGLRDLVHCQRMDVVTFRSLDSGCIWSPVLRQALLPQVAAMNVAAALLRRPERGELLRCVALLRRVTFARGTKLCISTLAQVRGFASQLENANAAAAAHRLNNGGIANVLVGNFDLGLNQGGPVTTTFAMSDGALDAQAVRGQLQMKLILQGKHVFMGAKYSVAPAARASGVSGVLDLQANVASSSNGLFLSFRGVNLRTDGIMRRAEHGMWALHGASDSDSKSDGADDVAAAQGFLCVLCVMNGAAPKVSSGVVEALQLDRPRRSAKPRSSGVRSGEGVLRE
eukprot:TRINITY_DN33491_c0_g1_i1.p1 TRINITY_DN33491_c0_g1~~TRINITY_DN33491_c0_g1_i1.p1  ORF type:complete len:307 (-),score=76.76 TRINITY_DN33491_c0_g1_i1:18-938(-)